MRSATGSDRLTSERLRQFRSVRAFSLTLAETLSPEDCAIQSMPDVSPTRWHLAHTTWFFETFILRARP
ncbi:MAG: DinB family protein, partial [Acidobacteriota bacterium]|nr:DinB family protein [Acidobacteriota bacterium]